MTALSGTKWIGEMDDRLYHSDPCERPSLSSSIAGVIWNQSLAHANMRHPKFGGTPLEATKAMDEGDMLHALLLTGKDSQRVQLIDDINPKTREAYSDFKTKAARDARDRAIEDGKTPVLPHKMRVVRHMYASIYEAMVEKGVGLLGVGRPEQVIIWETTADNGDVVQCRTKIDNIDMGEHEVYPPENPEACSLTELKTAASAHPAKVQKSITADGYDIQIAAQIEAVETLFPQLAGRVPARWVFVEKEPPWCVTEVVASQSTLEVGRRKWRYAVNQFAEALRSSYWPDYTGKDSLWSHPSTYALQEVEERLGEP